MMYDLYYDVRFILRCTIYITMYDLYYDVRIHEHQGRV